jgi:hypothetical protein
MAWAVRRASAMQVSIGFDPTAVGNAEVSPTHTPGVSWSCPSGSATLAPATVPIRAVPIWWALNSTRPAAPERRVLGPEDEVLDVLALPPQRQLPLGVEHDPGAGVQVQLDQAADGVPSHLGVDVVVEGVADQGLVALVEGDRPAAVVAGHGEVGPEPREAPHDELVPAAGGSTAWRPR